MTPVICPECKRDIGRHHLNSVDAANNGECDMTQLDILREQHAADAQRIAELEAALDSARCAAIRMMKRKNKRIEDLKSVMKDARNEIDGLRLHLANGQMESAWACIGLALTAIDAALQARGDGEKQ